MSDKISTSDCVKAICDFWQKAIEEDKPLPIGNLGSPVDSSILVNPKAWKRVKKFGNAATGFVRLFTNDGVQVGSIVAWVMVVRSTDDEIYDVAVGATVEGELVKPEEFDAKMDAALASKEPKEKDTESELTEVLGFKPASYEEIWGKDSAEEPLPIDNEEAWLKIYGEDYKKFPTDGFGQPEPPADPLIPGGAIHLNMDKEFSCVERSSRKQIKFMEAKYEHKFTRKKIKSGAVFLFLSPDDAKVEDVLTFPKGGMAYIDSDEGPFPDYGSVDNLFLEDDVGNVWLAGGEPQDDTKTVDECWEGEYLKRAKDAIAKYGATVVIRHM